MPGTIAYPSRGHHTGLVLNYIPKVEGIASTPKDDQASQPAAEDDYQSKLIKYIPGEALAFYAPLAPGPTGKVATIVITLIGVPEQIYISGNLHAALRNQKNSCVTTILCRLSLFWSGP